MDRCTSSLFGQQPRGIELLEQVTWAELADRYGDRTNDEIYWLNDLPAHKWAAAYLRDSLAQKWDGGPRATRPTSPPHPRYSMVEGRTYHVCRRAARMGDVGRVALGPPSGLSPPIPAGNLSLTGCEALAYIRYRRGTGGCPHSSCVCVGKPRSWAGTQARTNSSAALIAVVAVLIVWGLVQTAKRRGKG